MPETADTTAFVEDGMSAEKAQDPRGTAKRFLRDLMVQKWRLLTIAICLVGAAACSVLIPITIGAAIDEIFSGVKQAVENETVFQVGFETMSAVLIELVVLYVLSAALTFAGRIPGGKRRPEFRVEAQARDGGQAGAPARGILRCPSARRHPESHDQRRETGGRHAARGHHPVHHRRGDHHRRLCRHGRHQRGRSPSGRSAPSFSGWRLPPSYRPLPTRHTRKARKRSVVSMPRSKKA